MGIGPHTLTRLRDPETDDFGDPVGGTGGELDLVGCAVYPRGSSTEEQGRSVAVVIGYTALVPEQVAGEAPDILPTDRLRWLGEDYTVEGEPGQWHHMSGGLGCVQVAMQRIERG
jgi:hypothetical protein